MTLFYHLIILDASGSMQSIMRQAITGCNETIQTVRSLDSDPNCCHYLSLVTFNSGNRTNTIIDCQPAREVQDLPEEAYLPNGCTPLYDCVGLSVCHLQDRIKQHPGASALVTIITDGQENSSSIFDAAKVKSLVEECKQQGWTFAFIGANQDEVWEAQKMGIHNSLSFCQTPEGASRMFRKANKARIRFCLQKKELSPEQCDSEFFLED